MPGRGSLGVLLQGSGVWVIVLGGGPDALQHQAGRQGVGPAVCERHVLVDDSPLSPQTHVVPVQRGHIRLLCHLLCLSRVSVCANTSEANEGKLKTLDL